MKIASRPLGIFFRLLQQSLSRWLTMIASMRFAISLLSLLAIASIMGTVLKQNEPMPNYVNQLGPFWFKVFQSLGLYSVYSSTWFLAIMAFLIISTSLCVVRNTPKILADIKSWRAHVHQKSLYHFPHHAEWESPHPPSTLAIHLQTQLASLGYRTKAIMRDEAILIAAKKGAVNKLGYIFAHTAIVIILLGALLDGRIFIQLAQWMEGKTPFEGSGLISDIANIHRLSPDNPSFRGNILLSEGQSGHTAVIPESEGVFIQELPFSITLKKFVIDFYRSGMPKLFASEIDVYDPITKRTFSKTVKVNEPFIYRGIAIYQSGFDDGGSQLQLTAYPMQGAVYKPFTLNGEVGGKTALSTLKPQPAQEKDYTIEWTSFRPFNVETMAPNASTGPTDTRAVTQLNQSSHLIKRLEDYLGAATKNEQQKNLKNIGASIQYKLRDQSGQAREYHNYMQSVQLDGAWVFLSGVRTSPSEPFRYLRIPADDEDTVIEWMRLRAALMDPTLRQQAALAYSKVALPHEQDASTLREQLYLSAHKGLSVFAGNHETGGFIAVSQFLQTIPSNEQNNAAHIFMKILHGTLWELWQLIRLKDNLPPLPLDEKHTRFLQLAIQTYSDAFFYQAPLYLQLNGYKEIKASVLQVTKSPGKPIVYVGCLLLVLGILAMFYIRERRIWVWITPQITHNGQKSHAIFAMSTQRKTYDFEKEYEKIKAYFVSTTLH